METEIVIADVSRPRRASHTQKTQSTLIRDLQTGIAGTAVLL